MRAARPSRSTTAGPAAAIALLAACSLLAACGKGGSVQQATETATASSSARAPQPHGGGKPLTHARATAFARSVNLKPADLPGFSASRLSNKPETAAEQRLEHQLQGCLGSGAGGEEQGGVPPEERSPEFTHRGPLRDKVSSAVSFSPSAALAARNLSVLRSARTKACLIHYLNAVVRLRLGSSAFRRVSLAQGKPPAPGTSGGFAWRITAYANIRGLTVPIYLDILGFVYGPAQVRLVSSGVLVPFPATAQEHLYTMLLERAKTHPL